MEVPLPLYYRLELFICRAKRAGAHFAKGANEKLQRGQGGGELDLTGRHRGRSSVGPRTIFRWQDDSPSLSEK